MNTRPSKSKRTDTLVPYTTLVRSLRLGRRLIDLRKSGVEVARLLKLLRFGERRLHRPAQLQRLLLLRFLRGGRRRDDRSEEHTSELQSLMRISYAVFCLKKKIII